MLDGLRMYLASTTGMETWNVANGRWTKSGVAFGGDVRALAAASSLPGTVYACAHHDGLYRTTDAGASWRKVLDDDVRAVAVDPDRPSVVYTGTEPVHLLRSDDGGDSWTEVESLQRMPEDVRGKWWFPQEPHNGHVLKIHLDASAPQTLYLCLEHGGVVRSLDGGGDLGGCERGDSVSRHSPYRRESRSAGRLFSIHGPRVLPLR
jgi:photosystem II stability/assembly factor-like uncharacterized protein